jgi:hypothetical protein
MAIKPTADFRNFEALDIRAGRIVRVDDAQTRKPTYKLTIDVGPEIGTKVSCGAYRNYPKEALIGKTVVCVVKLRGQEDGAGNLRSIGAGNRQCRGRDRLPHHGAERSAGRRSILIRGVAKRACHVV